MQNVQNSFKLEPKNPYALKHVASYNIFDNGKLEDISSIQNARNLYN
jgi:hypothetical protein